MIEISPDHRQATSDLVRPKIRSLCGMSPERAGASVQQTGSDAKNVFACTMRIRYALVPAEVEATNEGYTQVDGRNWKPGTKKSGSIGKSRFGVCT